jgi:hypothetical protein
MIFVIIWKKENLNFEWGGGMLLLNYPIKISTIVRAKKSIYPTGSVKITLSDNIIFKQF